MAAKGCYIVEKLRRCVRTAFFVVAMVASLLVSSLPVLVAIGDVTVPCVLISSFTCVNCYGIKEHLRRYSFKSSLTDIPIVSIVRSLIVMCAYLICDGPALSHGPYLGTVTLCSLVSILLLSVKACVFSMNSQMLAEASASSSLARQKLHLKKSWGMPVLFLSSVVFALGHIVVAYRASCRARRKFFFHRVDPEAVLLCKNVFSAYHKVPRSPTPSSGRNQKGSSEIRRKSPGAAYGEKETSIRVLADADSCFVLCQGIRIHYKISSPSSPSLSSAPLLEPNCCCTTPQSATGRLISDRPFFAFAKTHLPLQRSYSIQLNGSSLYAPLLDSSESSPVLGEIPSLNLDDANVAEVSNVDLLHIDSKTYAAGQFGVVLVHGFGGGVFSWRNVMGVLAQEVGCSVVAFDRPGWGLSSRPGRKDWEEKELPNPYKLDSQVDLLLSFCSEMGFSSVVLVGHDDGGLLALRTAQRVQTSLHSSKVTVMGVVLVSTCLSREVVPAFARILLHTSLGKKHLVRPLLRAEITHVVNRRAWYDAAKLTPEVLSLYKAPLFIEGWDEALHEIGKVSNETVLSTQSASELMKAVEHVPVLVITGSEDSLVPLKSSQSMALKFANSRLVAISGCGHLPHEECPKALLAAMSPFIGRIISETGVETNSIGSL